jgi:hypothetical protein
VSPEFAGRHGSADRRWRTGGLAPPSLKPFWADREAFRKQRWPRLPGLIKQRGAMMVAFLNAIYRQFLRASLSGAKVAGARSGRLVAWGPTGV